MVARSPKKEFPAIIATIVLAFFIHYPIFAQSWQVFTVDNGLPSSNVTAFSSNPKYLAAGTNSGIALYDGDSSSWQIPPFPEEIASASVKDLAFDQNGGLWIATSMGVINYYGKRHFVYGKSDGLPNVDADRIQVSKNKVFVGCFGGYVSSAVIPQGGRTSFVPVNYSHFEKNQGLKIRAVGVSGLAMNSSARGWYSSMGEGLVEMIGSNEYPINTSNGLAADWVNDFFIFESKSKKKHILAATTDGISLLKDTNVYMNIRVPDGEAWATSIAAIKDEADIAPFMDKDDKTEDETKLHEFLEGRIIFVGTRSHGLWRFRNGYWKNFTESNSQLPGNCINRLFVLGKKLVIATNAGLVLMPIHSQMFDEFKNTGIGNAYAKTIFPMPPSFQYMIPFRQVLRGKDYWFTHKHGLSRYKTKAIVTNLDTAENVTHSSRMELSPEEQEKIAKTTTFQEFPDLKEGRENVEGSLWQMFSNEYMTSFDERILFPIYSNNISRIAINQSNQDLWIIFENKRLCRLSFKMKLNRKVSPPEMLETPVWEFMDKYQPWSGDTILTTVWFNDGKLYIGTKGDGFYILKNSSTREYEKNPFEWQHYGIYERLPVSTVLEFTKWKYQDVDYLVLMHPQAISLWNGEFFSELSIGGMRKNHCIAADNNGNLYVGTDGGLVRVTEKGKTYSYTCGNVFLESDYITAIGIPPSNSKRKTGIWVACDKEASFTALNDNFNGSDQPPNVYTLPDGTKKVVELDIDGASMHFFDGQTWEKWKVPGVTSMFIDNDYLWTTSNIRVRRFLVPR